MLTTTASGKIPAVCVRKIVLGTVWSLLVKCWLTGQHGPHTTGERVWKETVVMEGGGHGQLTITCYWKPERRRFFVPFTVDHYIIFPAGFTTGPFTDPPPPWVQTSTLSQLPLTTAGLVSMSPSKLPTASFYLLELSCMLYTWAHQWISIGSQLNGKLTDLSLSRKNGCAK